MFEKFFLGDVGIFSCHKLYANANITHSLTKWILSSNEKPNFSLFIHKNIIF